MSEGPIISTDSWIAVETKIAHHEIAIEELQQVVFEQHRTIERLEKSLRELTQRFEGAIQGPDIGPGDQKPPHY